jgi:hypothetical protein
MAAHDFIWTASLWYDDITPVDHQELGVARLIWQYRGERPRLQGWLDAYLDGDQSIENVLLQVLVGRSVKLAIGVQLDMIGRVVRQQRGELADDAYRLMLLGRIFVNHADGTIPDILELFNILNVEGAGIHEMYPAGIHIDAAGMLYPEQVGDLLFDIKPAGARLNWLYSTSAIGTIFRTSSTLGTDEVTATEGTDDLGGGVGGILSHTRWTR